MKIILLGSIPRIMQKHLSEIQKGATQLLNHPPRRLGGCHPTAVPTVEEVLNQIEKPALPVGTN